MTEVEINKYSISIKCWICFKEDFVVKKFKAAHCIQVGCSTCKSYVRLVTPKRYSNNQPVKGTTSNVSVTVAVMP